MSLKIRTLLGMGVLAAAVGVAQAQVSSKSTETKGAAEKTHTTQTINAEIVSVSGNTVVAKTAQGSREYKVPDGFMFQMDGKDIGVADLKPGMKVSATITTTTTSTPVRVTEVRQAEVLAVTGGALVVRGPKGIRQWTAKDIKAGGFKIYREGKEAQIGDFHAGDKITATIVSKKPPQVVTERSMKKARAEPGKPAVLSSRHAADTTLWSSKRIQAYEKSLQKEAQPPLAILRIASIGLEVPVLNGTDDFTLNRSVGWIDGTARPGAPGNVGIAGHRDGFFRGLKDVHQGDPIELETLAGSRTYSVADIRIVSPEDVSVLEPTPGPALTLVTCYPFYFVGDAPKRFIVRALPADAAKR